MNRRDWHRIARQCPVTIDTSVSTLSGQMLDISPGGLKMVCGHDILESFPIQMRVNLSPETLEKEITGQVRWKQSTAEGKQYVYGMQFVNSNNTSLKTILREMTLNEIEDFLGMGCPPHVRQGLDDQYIWLKLTQGEIMGIIDFAPPFLKVEKMVILDTDKGSITRHKAIAFGVMTQSDTEGHYNNTIFLALCGRLMGQAASAHLAALFPGTAPQVVKVDHIRPVVSSEGGLWKPNRNGSHFFIETFLLKRECIWPLLIQGYLLGS